MTAKTKTVMTLHWKIPPELKEFLEGHRDSYVPVFAGGRKTLESTGDGWLAENCVADDDFEDNISALNPVLNEMTAIYLAWRNGRAVLGDAEYAGHCHYRRFFRDSAVSRAAACDGLVSPPVAFGAAGGRRIGVETQYALCHVKSDFDVLKRTVAEEGLFSRDAWDMWANANFLFAPCNIFLFRRGVFEEYCGDLFRVVLKLPSSIDVEGRDGYQRRACSFLAERFTSYWCFKAAVEGKTAFRVAELETHEEWKPGGSGSSRGSHAGEFQGANAMENVRKWVAEHGRRTEVAAASPQPSAVADCRAAFGRAAASAAP